MRARLSFLFCFPFPFSRFFCIDIDKQQNYIQKKILLLYFLIVSIVLANQNQFQWRLWLLFDPDKNCAVIYSSIKNLLLTHHPTKQNQSSFSAAAAVPVGFSVYPFVQLLVCALLQMIGDWCFCCALSCRH